MYSRKGFFAPVLSFECWFSFDSLSSPPILLCQRIGISAMKKIRTPILEMPDDILVNIVSRLPAKVILKFRCVCKTWLNLLSQPDFAKAHFLRAPLGFLIRTHALKDLHVIELGENELTEKLDVSDDDDAGSSIHFDIPLETLELGIPLKTLDLFSSCNGLLLMGQKYTWKPFYIYNPITREYKAIPQTVKKPYESNRCWFGFSPKTKEFKLLRSLLYLPFHKEDPPIKFVAEIQTVGTNLWRTIGEIPSDLFSPFYVPFLSGALHWIRRIGDEFIYSFDFENEKFQPFPTPPIIVAEKQKESQMGLGILRGCLCLTHQFHNGPLVIWVMNEYGLKESWTKQFVISNMSYHYIYKPVRYMKSGEILMLCGERNFIY
ncbi:hypothetical protein F0562_020601 [Nyssa sinensis]|uniref:F-box domain-containing protein n=1 Tax=Nyssa sinensis TaxID=561372 RepID=A0A5J5BT09_9ASTE|nr:hypothetical protein F0562_020601 [Nyssa sinensis]